MRLFTKREPAQVDTSRVKRRKLTPTDSDSGNESDASVIIEQYPAISNGTVSRDQAKSKNQNETPPEPTNEANDEPTEQVDIDTKRRVHGDQNEEIGRVMGFGSNSWGALQQGMDKIIRTPTTLDQIGEAKFVNTNNWVCSIDENGKLRIDGEETNIDKKIKYADEFRGSVFAIDEDDCLWSWGKNDPVPLGHGHKEKEEEPKQIEALKHYKIKQVCCDWKVASCVTMDGQLFVWGEGDMFGFKEMTFDNPIGVAQCGPIQQIAMSDEHALLLCSDGNVYSIGPNIGGKLGLGHRNEVTGFNKIDLFDSMEVLKVQAGVYNSSVLTKSGDVYVFGRWSEMIYSTPQLIKGLTGVVDISMSWVHILALTDKNELFAWGSNGEGQCGVGSEADYISTPTRVSGFEDKDILQISAGAVCSLVKYKTK